MLFRSTPVYSVANGVIKHAAKMGNYGNLVIIDHGAGISTYYAHLSAFEPNLAEGSMVQRGQQIGLVGSTGRSTGPHLHFEIRRDGTYLDPANPAQSLTNWVMSDQDQEQALRIYMGLQISRSGAFKTLGKAQTTNADEVMNFIRH